MFPWTPQSAVDSLAEPIPISPEPFTPSPLPGRNTIPSPDSEDCNDADEIPVLSQISAHKTKLLVALTELKQEPGEHLVDYYRRARALFYRLGLTDVDYQDPYRPTHSAGHKKDLETFILRFVKGIDAKRHRNIIAVWRPSILWCGSFQAAFEGIMKAHTKGLHMDYLAAKNMHLDLLKIMEESRGTGSKAIKKAE
ncbi:hypothetical protein B0I35DRAFT_409964 [Stachybotrys elegans]|uniref:Uncharacterized protein n=1 Tax=Stachybotrys elegans TaxID=80388 RepID=A0A8K0WQ19_9HYPO|nr:hypothetical protein B0I35DRAFT_409964 [Stachybotrys elegans]